MFYGFVARYNSQFIIYQVYECMGKFIRKRIEIITRQRIGILSTLI